MRLQNLKLVPFQIYTQVKLMTVGLGTGESIWRKNDIIGCTQIMRCGTLIFWDVNGPSITWLLEGSDLKNPGMVPPFGPH